ncbi:MMPL family transporter [Kineosporia succinea]|uniref:RND superfamily putative drug exporter n=1 Tax=Kineosporia succinea TaxID=84632 RepID=A0ABT9P5C2_9ACTN|nr:MMPL family transporter [Kineosporia succinea]MDP9827889.1 RND superfamily putative drug exporter [Kineosporia succinea]
MTTLSRLVIARRWWVVGLWVALTAFGAFAAPKATERLTFDFGLPGQPAYETNVDILEAFGSGGNGAPVLLVVGDGTRELPDQTAGAVAETVARAAPKARIATWADDPDLLFADGKTGVVLVYPVPVASDQPYAPALSALRPAAEQLTAELGTPVVVTGRDALNFEEDDTSGSALAETLAGGIGAAVVLTLVFGSFLALMPLVVAAASILTTFAILWGLTGLTDVSFVVQYLLALIGLGVAIDYALLLVTRWREETGNGASPEEAVRSAMSTAGRSVLFSGITVAVSLAALIAVPVPFIRSVGYTGLLIPILSVAASLTLLPALLLILGQRLSWPHRRTTDPESRLWRGVGRFVVRYRWISAVVAAVALIVLALPSFGLRLGQATNDSIAAGSGAPAAAIRVLAGDGPGAGLSAPVEILTDSPESLLPRLRMMDGVGGVASPGQWRSANGEYVVDVWTQDDANSRSGAAVAAEIRDVAEGLGARVGGIPAQDEDFISSVYGSAGWILVAIVVVTFVLLAAALRSIVLPAKALLLNVISLGAAFGVTVWIWQGGHGTELLFDRQPSGAVTVWIPIAIFAFLFGLSMDYEVFLLSRIKEEHDAGHSTDEATVHGVARTGRLVTSAALILFLAFVSLSQIPTADVKILATGLALGIIIDATVVRGVLAPALVAALGPANWWWPFRHRKVTSDD